MGANRRESEDLKLVSIGVNSCEFAVGKEELTEFSSVIRATRVIRGCLPVACLGAWPSLLLVPIGVNSWLEKV